MSIRKIKAKTSAARAVIERIDKPTPKKWKRLGNALLMIGGAITESALHNDNITLAKIALACTIMGKLITSLMVEKEEEGEA